MELGSEDNDVPSQPACTAPAVEHPASADHHAVVATGPADVSRPGDEPCCGVLYPLQLLSDRLQCKCQNRVTVVDSRCDKGMNQGLQRVSIQKASNTSQLAKPEETCLANTGGMTVKTKVSRNRHTKKSDLITESSCESTLNISQYFAKLST